MRRECILRATLLAALLWVGHNPCLAQTSKDAAGWGRRGGGVTVSAWRVGPPDIVRAVQPVYKRSVLADAYFRRGLSDHLALESSLGYWRRTSERPGTAAQTDTTRVYIIPLVTALRIYPLTTVRNPVEPYVQAGAGFSIGVQQQSESTAGQRRSIAFGFGVKAAVGVEVHAYGPVGVTVGGHYQGVRFGQTVDEQEAFGGTGLQGGITYRFNF